MFLLILKGNLGLKPKSSFDFFKSSLSYIRISAGLPVEMSFFAETA